MDFEFNGISPISSGAFHVVIEPNGATVINYFKTNGYTLRAR